MGRKTMTANRLVPDPSMTDAEYYAQRAANPTKPQIGKVWVEERAETRIGALAFIRRKLGHHEKAAEWFKNAYEALYGGIAPAIDMSKVRVDTSIMAHDNGAVARLDRSEQLRALIVGTRNAPPLLSKDATDRIVACVVLGIPCNEIAAPGPSGKPSGHAVEREVGLLLEALDYVAELLGFKMRGAA